MTGSRPSSSARGYTSRWQKASKTYLEHNPLCVRCAKANRTTAATVVDHIVPHHYGDTKRKGDPIATAKASALLWDQDNWQGLCGTCYNSAKQREERSGVVVGSDPNGWPLDPNHHWNKT